jgi:hypothetical protein
MLSHRRTVTKKKNIQKKTIHCSLIKDNEVVAIRISCVAAPNKCQDSS